MDGIGREALWMLHELQSSWGEDEKDWRSLRACLRALKTLGKLRWLDILLVPSEFRSDVEYLLKSLKKEVG
mgnify:CR=1 FL=1